MVALLLAGCGPLIEVQWHHPPEVVLPVPVSEVAWTARSDVPAVLVEPILVSSTSEGGLRVPAIAAGRPPCLAPGLVVLESAVVVRSGSVRSLSASWTAWDCSGLSALDESTIVYELPEGAATDEQLASTVGAIALDRLVEDRGQATRRLYARGDRALAAGSQRAEVADWRGAVDAWRAAFASRSTRVRGKAAYNLAVASELTGRPAEARRWAADATSLLDAPRARRYLAALEPGESDE